MKKIILLIITAFSVFVLVYAGSFIFGPVLLIDGESYNSNKLKNISRQRETAYVKLHSSLQDEINNIINAEPLKIDIKKNLESFYSKSIIIDDTFHKQMAKSKNKFSFSFQRKETLTLNDIFPAYISVIENNDLFYNLYALKIFFEQYENITGKIIEIKTNDFINYIDNYSNNAKTELSALTGNFFDNYTDQCAINDTIISKINYTTVKKSDVPFLNVPVIKIDNDYSSAAVSGLQASMKTVSAYLLNNIKNILTEGVSSQTEIFSRNIDNFLNWFSSAFSDIGTTITNIIGFITGEKTLDENFIRENFNKIINDNADFSAIVKNDINNYKNIINKLFNEYMDLKNYFTVNDHERLLSRVSSGIITADDFIGAYSQDILKYFNYVFDALENANIFNIQDLLNRQESKRKISDSVSENQKNKLEIINDPYKYLIDNLSAGSVIFVDNYFIGYNAYQHYGVYIGDKKVVHFAPYEGQEISFENGVIHETTLEKFLRGRTLQVDTEIEKKFTDSEIIRRARSRINEKGYDLLTNNCEHFARWCVTGESVSYQIDNLPQRIDDTVLTIRDGINSISEFIEMFN